MISQSIVISGSAIPALERLSKTISSAETNRWIGEAVASGWKTKIRGFKGHQVGSVGFYNQCASSMTTEVVPGGVNVNINRVGFTVRALGTAHLPGGAIFPTGGRKYLTFAATSFTYGKEARDVSGLKFGFAANPATGRMQAMLYSPSGSETVSAARNRKRTGKGGEFPIKKGQVAYWLAKRAKQKGDRDLLLTKDEVKKLAGNALETRLTARTGL
jgi:hypothetical protein